MELRSGRIGKRKRTEDGADCAVLPGQRKVPDTGAPPSKKMKKQTTAGRTKTTKPGTGKGKRKRTEDGADCDVLLGPSKVPDTGAPPSKKMKKQATTGHTKTTKPETFDSLYEIGELLGEGSFGTVFKGTRLSDGLQVAIKWVDKSDTDQYVQSADGSKYVPVEVALMQKMSAPPVHSIINLIEWFDEPERYILILECPQPCTDLEVFLKSNGGSLSINMAKDLMLQVVMAAIQCHEQGVLHRDIKPKNIIINTDTLELKLTDFGSGDWVRAAGYKRFSGTFQYCSPEYFQGQVYHAMPATVWALGALLFRMVYGNIPFNSRYEILQGLSYIESRQSDVPAHYTECWNLIRWCLQSNPALRPTFQQILHHDFFESN